MNIADVKKKISFTISEEVTDDEASFILCFCRENNIDLMDELEERGSAFLKRIMEIRGENRSDIDTQNRKKNENETRIESANDKLITNDIEDENNEDTEDDSEFTITDDESNFQSDNQYNDKTKRMARLLLDDALKNTETKEGWSKVRIEAWGKKETKPNSFYYRFNDPGVKQVFLLISHKRVCNEGSWCIFRGRT